MSIVHQLKKNLAACSLGAAALAAVSPANAILVSGNWDPAYGSPFLTGVGGATDDMWWSGSALFYIPDTCTIVAGGTVTTGTAGCTGMSVTSAAVELREGQNGTLRSTLNFSPSAAITEIGFDSGGNVDYVISDWFAPMQWGQGATYDLQNYLFSLAFDASGAMLFHTSKDAYLEAHGGHGPDDNMWFWQGEGIGHIGDLCSPANIPNNYDGDNCGFSDAHGDVVFAPIPEPSTYALMFVGLAAVGFTARRRRKQA